MEKYLMVRREKRGIKTHSLADTAQLSSARLDTDEIDPVTAEACTGLVKRKCTNPCLNIAKLRSMLRQKTYSLEGRSREKSKTERQTTQQSTTNRSSASSNFQLPPRYEEKNEGQQDDHIFNLQITKPSCFLPSINFDSTTPARVVKIEQKYKSEERKKKLRTSVQCKILCDRKNEFPFPGVPLNDIRKSLNLPKRQQNIESEGSDLFELSISRIAEVEEPPSPMFAEKNILIKALMP